MDNPSSRGIESMPTTGCMLLKLPIPRRDLGCYWPQCSSTGHELAAVHLLVEGSCKEPPYSSGTESLTGLIDATLISCSGLSVALEIRDKVGVVNNYLMFDRARREVEIQY